MTRLLSQAEYGLWLQLILLSAFGAIADLGFASVFVRRVAQATTTRDAGRLIAAAVRFYRGTSIVLAAVLLGITLLPWGLVSPFIGLTLRPRLSAVLMVIPIAANLAVMPCTVVLLARGELARERWYGAAPGVFGTIATVGAALFWGRALWMVLVYAAVEIGFDAVLIWRIHLPARQSREVRQWRPLLGESWRVLVIDGMPQLVFIVDATIVGHLRGAAVVAIYGAAVKGSDVIRRLFSPLVGSLFLSFCRSRGKELMAVQGCARLLPWAVVAAGGCLAVGVASIGEGLTVELFGPQYGPAYAALAVLALAGTVRTVIEPQVRQLQAKFALGSLPVWVMGGFGVHVAVAVLLTARFGVAGTAGALLGTTLGIETVATLILSGRRNLDGRATRSLRRVVMVVLVLAAGTIAILTVGQEGRVVVPEGIGAAGLLGIAGFVLLLGYFRAAARVLRPST